MPSGEYVGRFLGQNFSGLRTTPELLENPEIPLNGTSYSLYAQEQFANLYFSSKAAQVQAELKALGIDSEMA